MELARSTTAATGSPSCMLANASGAVSLESRLLRDSSLRSALSCFVSVFPPCNLALLGLQFTFFLFSLLLERTSSHPTGPMVEHGLAPCLSESFLMSCAVDFWKRLES